MRDAAVRAVPFAYLPHARSVSHGDSKRWNVDCISKEVLCLLSWKER